MTTSQLIRMKVSLQKVGNYYHLDMQRAKRQLGKGSTVAIK